MALTFKQAAQKYLRNTYKPSAELKPRTSILRIWGGSRKRMVAWLTDNGGYATRHTRYALEWTVGAYLADLDKDRLEHWVNKLWREGYLDVEECNLPAFIQMAERMYDQHKEHMWEWGVEGAVRTLTDSDCYTSTFTGLCGLPVTYTLEGRGGKHLCMDTFRDINLHQSPDDLEADLLEKDDYGDYVVSHEHLIELFLLCIEAQVCFTTEAASEEVETEAWWVLICNVTKTEWENAQ